MGHWSMGQPNWQACIRDSRQGRHAGGVVGMIDGMDNLGYATAVGLARLAGDRSDREEGQWPRGENLDGAGFEAVFGRMKSGFKHGYR